MKKMSLDDWRQHVRQNHVPFRRDCRVCVEEMGQDVPHRRRKHRGAGDAVYVLAVDVAGPFVKGWDYGMAKEAKYALVATIPVPVGSRLADPKTSPCSETEAADDGLHSEVVNVMEVPATLMEIYLYLQILFNLFLNFVNAMVQILNMKEMLSMLLVIVVIKQSWTV